MSEMGRPTRRLASRQIQSGQLEGGRMRTGEGDKIFDVIRAHVGSENAISAPDICRELGWSHGCERNVRRIIAKESHLWPEIVCARAGDPTGGGGYFVAESYEE